MFSQSLRFYFSLVVLALIGAALFSCLSAPLTSTRSAASEITVIDADTLQIGSVRVRLRDLDAFEIDQRCRLMINGGSDYADLPCGLEAKVLVESMIEQSGHALDCFWEANDVDFYGRPLATCLFAARDGAEPIDLGAILVGYCRALPHGDNETYAKLYEHARIRELGFCGPSFVIIPPWEWRQGSRFLN